MRTRPPWRWGTKQTAPKQIPKNTQNTPQAKLAPTAPFIRVSQPMQLVDAHCLLANKWLAKAGAALTPRRANQALYTEKKPFGAFFHVAHSLRMHVRRKLMATNEVKCNCMRASKCAKESDHICRGELIEQNRCSAKSAVKKAPDRIAVQANRRCCQPAVAQQIMFEFLSGSASWRNRSLLHGA